VAFIVAGAAPPVLERHDLDADRAETVGDHISAGEFEAAFGAVSEAMVDAFCITGTPETVEEKIDGVLEYADSFVAGAPLGPDLETAVELSGAVLRNSRAHA
jgi:5,10-methylenetetrahydromethanopterin reductase